MAASPVVWERHSFHQPFDLLVLFCLQTDGYSQQLKAIVANHLKAIRGAAAAAVRY